MDIFTYGCHIFIVSISADDPPTKVEDTVADTEETDTAAADTTPSTKVTTAKIAVKGKYIFISLIILLEWLMHP